MSSRLVIKKDGTINNFIPGSIASFFFKQKTRAFTEIRGCLFILQKFENLFRQHVRSRFSLISILHTRSSVL